MKFKSLAVAGVVAALVGCTLTRTDLRQGADKLLPGLKQGDGKVTTPKFCTMKLVILSRPTSDEALQQILWRSADVQSIGDDVRKSMEANGLRAGVVTGELPAEVRAILDAPPPNQVNPSTLMLPDGDTTQVDLTDTRSELNLFLNRQGGVGGKRYKDANGHLRISASRQGESGVALRVVPEVHHGPTKQGWSTASGGAGSLAPQQLIMSSGQQQESFRDLAATIVLQPGQILVVGAAPDRRGSLGNFLFTSVEANSDRELGKVLLIWASRSGDGTPELTPPALTPTDPPDMPESSRRASARGSRPVVKSDATKEKEKEAAGPGESTPPPSDPPATDAKPDSNPPT